MSKSLPLLICVALNISLIGFFLLPPLVGGISDLGIGFKRNWRYLRCRLTVTREKAFRRITLMQLHRLALVVAYLIATALCYSPSMLLAYYQSSLLDAFFSSEAVVGMLV
ncbi:MAG: hypothetical protein GY784_05115, partial [Gammaproteobacteria bacterium]|nr:hypothetical protein [Gammaproteobacteria bacterium]